MEVMNNTSVAFELYVILFGSCFSVAMVGGLFVRRLLPHSAVGAYLLSGAWGALLGFVLLTLPYICEVGQHYWSLVVMGSHYREFPPHWFPRWLIVCGPFDGFVLGSSSGFACGCFSELRRQCRQRAHKMGSTPRPASPTQ